MIKKKLKIQNMELISLIEDNKIENYTQKMSDSFKKYYTGIVKT